MCGLKGSGHVRCHGAAAGKPIEIGQEKERAVNDALRAAADDAETICGEDYWPLPSYSKMLYYV